MRYAYELIKDGVSSQAMGYMIAQIGDSVEDGMGTSETNITSGNNITSDFRYLGSNEKQPLKFKVSLAKVVDNEWLELTADDRDYLDFWLTSTYGWSEFRFNQEDMISKYYMGRVNNVVWKNVDSRIMSCEFEIETNSPYGHMNKVHNVFDFTSSPNNITINNQSHGDRWTFPKLKITMATTGSDISIKNVTDKGREFTITGLVGSEVIEVDCKTGMIISSTDLNKKGNCNLKYPRLAYGINNFVVTGNIKKLEITYDNDRRIGA